MRKAAARRFISLGLSCTLAVAVSAGPAYAHERFGGFGGQGFFHGNGGGYHGNRGGGYRGNGFMPFRPRIEGGFIGGERRRDYPPPIEVFDEPEPRPPREWRESPERPIRPPPTAGLYEGEPYRPVRPPFKPAPSPGLSVGKPYMPVRRPVRFGLAPVATVTAPISPAKVPIGSAIAPIRPTPAPIHTLAAPTKPVPGPSAPPTPPPVAVGRVFTPPPGETRFRPGQVVVEVANSIPPATVALILRNHRLVESKVIDDVLLRTSVRLWRFPESRDVAGVVRELGAETALLSIQPNYIYELQQISDAAATAPGPVAPDVAAPKSTPARSETAAPPAAIVTTTTTSTPVAPAPTPLQYWLGKLNVDEGMLGDPIRVGVIDTAVDETHPDLVGAVEASFNAIGGAGAPRSLDHGTSIAGAIAARGHLKGIAPNVRIVSARAFDNEGGKAKGDTTSIVEALVWIAKEQARVVNMSFAGPQDPDLLHRNLAAALAGGMMIVGAAGNAGPKSPPLYPGADESVFAVTATDADDKLYRMANVGPYIAVAAPGVDVLLPIPRGGYSLQTGTSVSAALVSGVVALLLERRATATPAELKQLLMETATHLGAKDQTGAGLVDARRALSAQALPAPTN
jgi:hypothetical protein